MSFDKAIGRWTDDNNYWFPAMRVTPEEIKRAVMSIWPKPEENEFLYESGKWREWLDTCERERIADQVDRLRGVDPKWAYNCPRSFNRQ